MFYCYILMRNIIFHDGYPNYFTSNVGPMTEEQGELPTRLPPTPQNVDFNANGSQPSWQIMTIPEHLTVALEVRQTSATLELLIISDIRLNNI